jgi:myo-inositol-1(or 4)-monophosphatase
MDQDLLTTATLAARAGAEVLRRYFRTADLEIRVKGDNDFVTRADQESEAAIVGVLRGRFPDHDVLGEEGGFSAGGVLTSGGAEHEWLIDPLDGTTNFLQGLGVFAISIGCRHRGEMAAAVVYDPIGEHLFTAARGAGAFWNGRRMAVSGRPGLSSAFLATGYPFRARASLDVYLAVFRDVFLEARAIRRCGAAALDLAYTAAGVYDGFFEFRLSPWDIAAGLLLVREAGGLVSDLDGGERFFDSGNVIAGAPGVHRDLLQTVRRHVDETRLDTIDPRPAATQLVRG